jgi:hypothetical protein
MYPPYQYRSLEQPVGGGKESNCLIPMGDVGYTVDASVCVLFKTMRMNTTSKTNEGTNIWRRGMVSV